MSEDVKAFDADTPKHVAEMMAKLDRNRAVVDFRFPVGEFKKAEDMIGHCIRVDSDRMEPGVYFAESVDSKGRVVLEPYQLDRTYAWDDGPALSEGG